MLLAGKIESGPESRTIVEPLDPFLDPSASEEARGSWYMLRVEPRRPSVASMRGHKPTGEKRRKPEPLRLSDGGMAAPDGVPMRMEFLLEELLTRRGVVAWVPRESFWIRANRYHRRAKRLVHQPILPGYVLTCLPQDVNWLALLALPLVRGVVGHNGIPMRLPLSGIERLRQISLERRAEEWQRPMPTHRAFRVGQEVEVLEGGLRGQTVKVVALHGGVAKVFCRFFGSEHEAKIAVEKLGALV